LARRDDVIIATKGGLRKEGAGLVRDAGARALRAGVEASLRNLDTDYIDLYQVHWPDPATPAEETATALEEMVAAGMIRHAGVSNYEVKQIDELGRVGPVETLQPPYHMFRRDIEVELLPYTSANDIGVLTYGPLGHGLLGGDMSLGTTFAPDDWRGHSPDFTGTTFRRNLAVVDRLRAFAAARSFTLPQLAVGWAIDNPAVDVAIVGAQHPAQLDGLLPAVDLALTTEDRDILDSILADAAHVTGPHPEGM
jgi:aryl-alcohol dehydrogenase-like predicted oxidoreductase